MSKFLKIVVVLVLILLIEALFIYLGYVRNKETDIKYFNSYDKNIIILSYP